MKKILLLLNVLFIIICFMWSMVALSQGNKLFWFPLILIIITIPFGLFLIEKWGGNMKYIIKIITRTSFGE